MKKVRQEQKRYYLVAIAVLAIIYVNLAFQAPLALWMTAQAIEQFQFLLKLISIGSAAMIAVLGWIWFPYNQSEQRTLIGAAFFASSLCELLQVVISYHSPLKFSYIDIVPQPFALLSVIFQMAGLLSFVSIPESKECFARNRYYLASLGVICLLSSIFIFNSQFITELTADREKSFVLKRGLDYLLLTGYIYILIQAYRRYEYPHNQGGFDVQLGSLFLVLGQFVSTGFSPNLIDNAILSCVYRTVGMIFWLRGIYRIMVWLPLTLAEHTAQEVRDAQTRLMVSEARFRGLVESMDDFVFTLDAQTQFTSVFGRWYKKMGFKEERYLGKTVNQVLPEASQSCQQAINEAMHSEDPIVFELERQYPAGKKCLLTTINKLESTIPGGDVLIGVGKDITDMKRSQLGFEQQRKLLDILHSCTRDFIGSGYSGEVFHAAMNKLMELMESGSVSLTEIYTEDSTERRGEFWNYCSPDMPGEECMQLLSVSERLCTQMLETSKACITLEKVETTFVLAVPIRWREKLVGVWCLARYSKPYKEKDIAFLQPFTDTCGLLLTEMQYNRKKLADEKLLNESRLAAQAAINDQTNFIARVSHELRTPMNSIIGIMELLLDAPLAPEHKQNVRTVFEASSAMMTILDDVLDLAKIGNNQIELREVPFDLQNLIAGVLTLYAQSARQKDTTLSAYVDEDVPSVLVGDPVRIRQVLSNLISNSIKFTQGGKVIVRAQCTEIAFNQVIIRFEVIDTGAGIDESLRSQLFKPYRQVSDSIEQRMNGSGLGLSIAKNLCERMGGNIGLKSQVGAGSIFWFTIPFTVSAKATPETSPSYLAANAALFHGSILVVDDNAVNQELVQMQLAKLGYTSVHSVYNGLEAVAAASVHDYSLILMDCYMPVMDGFAAVKEIRRIEKSKGYYTPIIALTSHAEPYYIEECKAIGMDDAVIKPVSLAQLSTIVNCYIKNGESAASTSLDAEEEHSLDDTIIDWDVVREISKLSSLKGKNMVAHVAALYSEEFPAKRDALLSAIESKDREVLRLAAHSLKSASSGIGAKAIAQLSEQLEKMKSNDELELAYELINEIDRCFRVTRQFLLPE